MSKSPKKAAKPKPPPPPPPTPEHIVAAVAERMRKTYKGFVDEMEGNPLESGDQLRVWRKIAEDVIYAYETIRP